MSRVYEALKKIETQPLENERFLGHEIDLVGVPGAIPTQRVRTQSERGDRLPFRSLQPRNADQPNNGLRSKASSDAKNIGASKNAPLLTLDTNEHTVAVEQFHLLALNLQSWATENDKRVFMITSALSGEGKSFIALNLAMSLSMRGNRVILVDADLRKPSLQTSFNERPTPGLLDYLNGEVAFEDCLHSTSRPGLLLVPSGGVSYTPTEALTGPRMREFIEKLRGILPTHYVIIDSAAASIVPEPKIVGRLADALVFVVAANQTPREISRQAVRSVSDTPIYGIVFNRFEPRRSDTTRYPTAYRLRAADQK